VTLSTKVTFPLRSEELAIDALGFKSIEIPPIDEIKRVSEAFGLAFNFMKVVAKIEFDFDTKQRTGSYIGLFQLSDNEFAKYGSGNILDARDNAVAAAYKSCDPASAHDVCR
jgi:hypothetical protein